MTPTRGPRCPGGAAEDPAERAAEREECADAGDPAENAWSDSEEACPRQLRNACASKYAANDVTVIMTPQMLRTGWSIAARIGRRRETAANVERIIPVAYSPVTNSTPMANSAV